MAATNFLRVIVDYNVQMMRTEDGPLCREDRKSTALYSLWMVDFIRTAGVMELLHCMTDGISSWLRFEVLDVLVQYARTSHLLEDFSSSVGGTTQMMSMEI